MTLTRNLYELDEVVSALHTCLRLRWPGLFWLCELVLSLEEEIAYNTLRQAWLLYGGGWDPAITVVTLPTTKPIETKEWIQLYLRITLAIQKAKNCNAVSLLQYRSEAPISPLPTARVLAYSTDELPNHESRTWLNHLHHACSNNKPEDAIWYLQAVQPLLCADSIWNAILHIAPSATTSQTVYNLRMASDPEPRNQILHQVAAILLLCAQSDEEKCGDMMSESKPSTYIYERDWGTWTRDQGRRSARRRDIPKEALHKGTTRGAMSSRYTNVDEVRYPVPLFTEGCRFWKEAVAAIGAVEDAETGTIVFPSDEALESAHALWFPDDIPDEWSAADQLKSHGRGCAETAATAPPDIWIREEPLPIHLWELVISKS